jgi:hypothetical protein
MAVLKYLITYYSLPRRSHYIGDFQRDIALEVIVPYPDTVIISSISSANYITIAFALPTNSHYIIHFKRNVTIIFALFFLLPSTLLAFFLLFTLFLVPFLSLCLRSLFPFLPVYLVAGNKRNDSK